jgi:hypothetical protein
MVKKHFPIIITLISAFFPIYLYGQSASDADKPATKLTPATTTQQSEIAKASLEGNAMVDTCEKQYATDPQAQSDCVVTGTEKLAESGNFIAAHFMGKYSADMGKKEEALKWYQAALDNPKTPATYKDQIKVDKSKIEQK